MPDGDAESPDAQLNDPARVALARRQIDLVLSFLPAGRRGGVVQGGARCGLWPWLLADHFAAVLAFEADRDNFACAELNLAGRPNVSLVEGALARESGTVRFRRSVESNGMHYVDASPGSTGNVVPASALDAVELEGVDALFLDVEGYELEVLRGAEQTLRRFRPVIIAEENSLIGRYGRRRGDLAAWLKRRGYRQAAEFYTHPPEVQHNGDFHGSDLIFVHEGSADVA